MGKINPNKVRKKNWSAKVGHLYKNTLPKAHELSSHTGGQETFLT